MFEILNLQVIKKKELHIKFSLLDLRSLLAVCRSAGVMTSGVGSGALISS